MKKNLEAQIVELLNKPLTKQFVEAQNTYNELKQKGFIKKSQYNLLTFMDKPTMVEFNKPFSAPKSNNGFR